MNGSQYHFETEDKEYDVLEQCSNALVKKTKKRKRVCNDLEAHSTKICVKKKIPVSNLEDKLQDKLDSKSLKKAKERLRRGKMSESVRELRRLVPGCNDEKKINQSIVMSKTVLYVLELDKKLSSLSLENSNLQEQLKNISRELSTLKQKLMPDQNLGPKTNAPYMLLYTSSTSEFPPLEDESLSNFPKLESSQRYDESDKSVARDQLNFYTPKSLKKKEFSLFDEEKKSSQIYSQTPSLRNSNDQFTKFQENPVSNSLTPAEQSNYYLFNGQAQNSSNQNTFNTNRDISFNKNVDTNQNISNINQNTFFDQDISKDISFDQNLNDSNQELSFDQNSNSQSKQNLNDSNENISNSDKKISDYNQHNIFDYKSTLNYNQTTSNYNNEIESFKIENSLEESPYPKIILEHQDSSYLNRRSKNPSLNSSCIENKPKSQVNNDRVSNFVEYEGLGLNPCSFTLDPGYETFEWGDIEEVGSWPLWKEPFTEITTLNCQTFPKRLVPNSKEGHLCDCGKHSFQPGKGVEDDVL